jgi:hypothetical protein
MSEVYPSDNELLNLESDSVTGVEYIATGQSPYYVEFRRMLYRLLLVSKLANELRVYDEGGLNVGVKGGSFWNGLSLVSYAGSIGNLLADDKDNIYLYINSSGLLVIDEYSGFPDMAGTSHVRLARVKTVSGDIESIIDCRGGLNFSLPYGAGGMKRSIEAHASDDTLDSCESGSVHTNLGATGAVTLTLPASSSAGVTFTFAVQANYELRVDPGSVAIRDLSGVTADKYKSSSSIGSSICVVCDSNGDWVVISKTGTWTEEA